MEIVGKLAERDLCITTIFDPIEVEPFLKSLSFDLIVIGLDDSRPALMDLIPKIRSQYPNLPVLVIGDRSTTECIECIQNFGAREYIALPSRIADLKAVVRHLRESYFSVIQ